MKFVQSVGVFIRNNWWLILIGLWLAYTFIFSADRDNSGNVTKSGWVGTSELQVGDCILDNDLVEDIVNESDDALYQYWVTPCEEEHTAEIFYKYDLGEIYNNWPGADELLDDMYEICIPGFENYIGLSLDELILKYPEVADSIDIGAFFPLEESWNLLKTYDCFVYSLDQELSSGSIKDTLL